MKFFTINTIKTAKFLEVSVEWLNHFINFYWIKNEAQNYNKIELGIMLMQTLQSDKGL
jgi:hypothetical protein